MWHWCPGRRPLCKKVSLIYSICQFSQYKYFYHGGFQATTMVSLNMKLGSDGWSWLSLTGTSWSSTWLLSRGIGFQEVGAGQPCLVCPAPCSLFWNVSYPRQDFELDYSDRIWGAGLKLVLSRAKIFLDNLDLEFGWLVSMNRDVTQESVTVATSFTRT